MGRFKEIDISIHDLKNIILSLCLLLTVISIIALISMQKAMVELKSERDYWVNQYTAIESEKNY